jgi:uncharacterized protein (DUF1501 family)
MMLNRRLLLAAGLGTGAATLLPRIGWAAADTDRRFVFILQRGAADGIGTVMPTGDPAYAAVRGELAFTEGTKLDSLFTLHPVMAESAKLFAQKEASFAHAIASGYRDRSHFDGQNVLESGAGKPYGRDDGWMNRLLTLLPGGERKALAISTAIPLSMRGSAEVSSYAPSRLPDANAELMERVAMLYAEDAQLGPLWARATQTEMMAAESNAAGGRGGVAAGKLIASLMNGPDGARVVMAESNGWDTHVRQKERLNGLLKDVDDTIATLRTDLGPAWSKTLVLVATEFGRTVAVNGTKGTDHGTASAAMLYGGGLVKGGGIVADWPGLAQAQLYEGRDLRPTMRFERLVIDTLSAHYGIDPGKLARTVFPDFA